MNKIQTKQPQEPDNRITVGTLIRHKEIKGLEFFVTAISYKEHVRQPQLDGVQVVYATYKSLSAESGDRMAIMIPIEVLRRDFVREAVVEVAIV